MRVILQDRKSLLYYKSTNEWTPDATQAVDFEYVANAIEFVTVFKLPAIDVVMHFGDPKYDIRLTATN